MNVAGVWLAVQRWGVALVVVVLAKACMQSIYQLRVWAIASWVTARADGGGV